MQVNHLLIEAFRKADEESVAASAILCTFDSPRYVGVRRTEAAERLGPASVIDPETRFTKQLFPDRLLPVERGRKHSFSYREPWTAPPWTLYLLAPPDGFHAQTLRLQLLVGAEQIAVRPASDEGHLYYWALVQGSEERVAFETEARFVYDPAAAGKAIERAEHVNAMRWKGIWSTVAEPLTAAGAVVAVAGGVASVATTIKMLSGH